MRLKVGDLADWLRRLIDKLRGLRATEKLIASTTLTKHSVSLRAELLALLIAAEGWRLNMLVDRHAVMSAARMALTGG